ncbi:MAG: UDP-glucose--hexose-phosphateuridylyltransferase [Thermoleophilia bacterium]|nr:UDP-glucose--hexose-phosphateuridylyltransferase [Thermoleophilia bacterium]
MRRMSIQIDPITGAPRLVAPGRAARHEAEPAACPFCAGNEAATPHETGRRSVGDDWTARSFPNLYPLTDPHEVLVPTPRHVTSWRDLTPEELASGISLLLERRAALEAEGRYVHAFVNDGTAAGASLAHAHAQLVVVDHEYGARLTRLLHGAGCALCTLTSSHEAGLEIERLGGLVVLAHPSPRLAGGLIITPARHEAEPAVEGARSLAHAVSAALRATDPLTDVNLWLAADGTDTHWYLEVQPRSANLAGVELALGIHVCAADPAATAAEGRARLAAHAS